MQSQKLPQAHLLPRRSLYAFRLPFAARTHALMLSSTAEIALTASAASATIADAILRQSVPLGEAAIAVALFYGNRAPHLNDIGRDLAPIASAAKRPLDDFLDARGKC